MSSTKTLTAHLRNSGSSRKAYSGKHNSKLDSWTGKFVPLNLSLPYKHTVVRTKTQVTNNNIFGFICFFSYKMELDSFWPWEGMRWQGQWENKTKQHVRQLSVVNHFLLTNRTILNVVVCNQTPSYETQCTGNFEGWHCLENS